MPDNISTLSQLPAPVSKVRQSIQIIRNNEIHSVSTNQRHRAPVPSGLRVRDWGRGDAGGFRILRRHASGCEQTIVKLLGYGDGEREEQREGIEGRENDGRGGLVLIYVPQQPDKYLWNHPLWFRRFQCVGRCESFIAEHIFSKTLMWRL